MSHCVTSNRRASRTEHLYLYLPLGLLCWSPWPWQNPTQYNSASLWTSTIITQHWKDHQSLIKLKWQSLVKIVTFGSTALFNVQDSKTGVCSWMIHSDWNSAHSVGKTYNAMVNKTMFPGDAVCLLLPSNYLDCPSVGVDLLCSITPFLLCFQEDKEDCPEVQQGHPGIHEKEDAWQGRLSVRLTASQAAPYSSKVEQWPGDERTETAIKQKDGLHNWADFGLDITQRVETWQKNQKQKKTPKSLKCCKQK